MKRSVKVNIIFLLILLVGLFVRVYKFYDIPGGIHVDEAGMFVDATMLSRFGVDRYDNKFPVYLQNCGGGQSVMYAYITAFLIKIFSSSYVLIRIPAVIFGMLLIVFSYLIAREFMGEKKSLLLMAMVAFCPYFIQSSRIGLDCNLFLPFFVISFYIYIRAIRSQSSLLFVLTGVFYSLCLYTYAIAYIVVPLFLLISLLYLMKSRLINLKKIVLMFLSFIIISVPIGLFLLVNYGIINELSFLIFSINKLPLFRTGELSISNVIDNLFIIIELLSFDTLGYNSIKYFGSIYYVFIPFFIIGFIKYIKKFICDIKNHKFDLQNLVFIMFVSCYISLMPIFDLNLNKANVIFFSVIYITVFGFFHKNNIFIYLLILCFSFFYLYYFNFYNYKDKYYFDDEIYKIVNTKYDFLKNKELIIISDNNQPYIYEQLGKVTKIDKKTEIFISNKDNIFGLDDVFIVDVSRFEKYTAYFNNRIKLGNYYILYN